MLLGEPIVQPLYKQGSFVLFRTTTIRVSNHEVNNLATDLHAEFCTAERSKRVPQKVLCGNADHAPPWNWFDGRRGLVDCAKSIATNRPSTTLK